MTLFPERILSFSIMYDVTLEKVMALNEELASLSAAGVPINLGDPQHSTEESLADINAALALRTSLGQPIDAALTDDQSLPTVYRNAVLTGMRTNQWYLALDGMSQQPTAWYDLRNTTGQALVQPLIVMVLAYFGFIVLCMTYFPAIDGIYQQLRAQPNWGVRFLAFSRAWMGVWVPLVPLLIVAGIILWHRRELRHRPWLPGSRRYLTKVAYSTFAEQLSKLLAAEVPFVESLRLAGKATNDESVMRTAEVVAAAREHNDAWTAGDEMELSTLPPLLRWVLTSNLEGESLPELLRFTAETYRQSADRQSAVWHIALPTVLSALLGGAIVLGYGLSLFVPYLNLMVDLVYQR
jgi:type II secretory pathway component PulF